MSFGICSNSINSKIFQFSLSVFYLEADLWRIVVKATLNMMILNVTKQLL